MAGLFNEGRSECTHASTSVRTCKKMFSRKGDSLQSSERERKVQSKKLA